MAWWVIASLYLPVGFVVPGDVSLVLTDVYPSKKCTSCSHFIQVGNRYYSLWISDEFRRSVSTTCRNRIFNSYYLGSLTTIIWSFVNAINCIYQVVTAFSLHGFLCCMLILFWMIVASWFTCSFIMRVVIYLTKRVCY